MPKQSIKVIFSDVDGTLTDGQLYYSLAGETMKTFNVKDGSGIKNWLANGFEFGVISARSSEIVSVRMKELDVQHVIMGAKDKKNILENWLASRGYSWENLAYIGDDSNDLPVIKLAGFSAAPADAVKEILDSVDYRCQTPGGRGAVREFIDFLLDNPPAS